MKTQTYAKHQVTLESNVDNEEQAPSVALTCVQQDDSTKEQQDKEKIPHKNKILKDAHYVKVEVVECATDQLSIVPEDLQLGEVEKIDDTMFPMIQNEIVLIPPIDTYDSRRV